MGMKTQETKLNPIHLAIISIAGKWPANNTLFVNICLGVTFMDLISPQTPFPEIINQKPVQIQLL